MRLFPSATEKHVQGIMKSAHLKRSLQSQLYGYYETLKAQKKKSSKTDMNVRVHMYECVYYVYGRERGMDILGEKLIS